MVTITVAVSGENIYVAIGPPSNLPGMRRKKQRTNRTCRQVNDAELN
jgi:hypothetical protein